MIIWNFETPLTFLASCLWNFCEYFRLSPKFAPQLFGLVCGRKGKKLS
jgi:hypothetical protein